VTYHPPGCEAPLLTNVNMELRNNSLGLVYGRSGSGKTTLLQLLSGLREQTSGAIRTVQKSGACSAGRAACLSLFRALHCSLHGHRAKAVIASPLWSMASSRPACAPDNLPRPSGILRQLLGL
jgi:energy-coupling factor transporter ATP-binding protein EcfA2